MVPPEGNAVARGRKFADEGRGPADQPEPPGPGPADQLDRGEQERGQKDEDVGAEEDGFYKEGKNVHQCSMFNTQYSMFDVRCSMMNVE